MNTPNPITSTDERHMARAARLAVRGHGGAEPNPLVGCVIVAPDGRTVGEGYHRQFGEAHAEVNALRAAGDNARGATAYLTLEPCNHTGKTPPCTQALIDAGVARVVIARQDPNPIAAGGVRTLREAGITVDTMPDFEMAVQISDPFSYRVRSGLPWIIAKWAQTLDGYIATRTGASQWISNDQSRRMVHRFRGRVDAILTGIGTVLADDPMLTARGVRVRRIARRVVVDPELQTPLESKLATTAGDNPTTIICRTAALGDRARALEQLGIELIPCDATGEMMPLAPALRELVSRYEMTNMLVEAGPGLIGSLFAQHLVKEAWVFIAPLLFGDDEALPPATGLAVNTLTDGTALKLLTTRRRGDDVVLRYRVS